MRLARGALLGAALLLSSSWLNAQTWPQQDWPQALASDSAQVQALTHYAFAPRDEAKRSGVRTDALLVVRDGQIVYERYAGPNTAQTPHLLWSMSKSVLATVMGVAYGQGRFKLDDPALKYVPALKEHPNLKLGHLFNWASGLNWKEDYEYAPLKSSVVAMLYTRGRQDMASFVARSPEAFAPGVHYSYSSGDSNLLSAALRGMVGAESYGDYPWTALFDPLGIQSAVWERDAAGTFVASSYAYMTARDMARVGLLMQRGGRWGDRQLLPEAWIAFNRTPFANYQADPQKPNEAVPGGQWWLNQGPPGTPTPWPDAPADSFAALGHWGQALYVLPEQKLVVVRFADDRDSSFSHNQLLKRVQAAFVKEQP